MSRSVPTNTLVNPAVRFLEWNSEKGQFKYYDRETKENVDVPLPIKFYVLDELTNIKGYSDKYQSGIWSNEVKNITTQKLKAVCKDKTGKIITLGEGFYQSIKDSLAVAGGKYTRSLYVAMLNDKDEYEIVNLQLRGAAFSGWLDFCNEKRGSIMTDEITCADFKREKKGATKYTIPLFTSELASEEGNEAAIALDVELQEYLTAYFTKTQAEVEYVEDKVTKSSKTTDDEDEHADDLPF